MLTPDTPRDPEFLERLRALAPDCVPRRRLRRARAAGGAGRPAARLGQPALLAAAGLARRGARAARRAGRRRRHRRHHVPARGGPGHRPGVRRRDRGDRPDDTAGDAARAAVAGPVPGCSSRTLDGIEDGHARTGPAGAARRLARPQARPSTTPGSTGPPRRCGVDRLVRACTPAPGAWTTLRGERLGLGPVRPVADGAPDLAPGAVHVEQERGPGRHRQRPGPARVRAARRASRAMPAADWARGAPAGAGGAVRAVNPRPYRRPQPDPPRRAAFDLAARGRRTGRLRQPGAARAAARARPGRARRRVRHRAGLRHAARAAGTYDAVLAACVDRPLDDGRPAGAGPAAARRPPAAGDARCPTHAAVGATVELASGDRRRRARGVRQRRAAQGGRARPRGLGRHGRPGPRRRTPSDIWPSRTSHPRWVVDALRDALGGRRGRAERAARAPTTSRPRSPWSPVPAASSVADLLDAGARARLGGRRTPRGWPGGDPGALAAVRDGRGRGPGRGQPAGRARALAAAPLERSRRCAGSTCAPAPAARRRCWPGWPPSAVRALLAVRAAAAPRRPRRRALGRPARAGTARRVVTADGAGRTVAARVVRPGAGRRAVHRSGGAAPPARGAVAPSTRRPRRAWVRCSARCSAAALDAVRPGGRRRLRHLLAAPGRDRGRRRRTCCGPRSDVEPCRTRARSCPGVPDLGDGPHVQLWPHRHGTDAMFLALLRREPV